MMGHSLCSLLAILRHILTARALQESEEEMEKKMKEQKVEIVEVSKLEELLK